MHFIEDLAKMQLPACLVDLDAFKSNAFEMARAYKSSNLTIRIATKSVRSPTLIKLALESSPIYKGLMCYSAQEILELAKFGLDDFLLAYPTLQNRDIQALEEALNMGKKIHLVVDCIQHLESLNKPSFQNNPNFSYLAEADMSLHLPGLVIGVRRSPLTTPQKVIEFCIQARDTFPELHFGGIMAYEAQVAGLPDRNPFKSLLNPALKLIRKISVTKSRQRRAQIKKLLEENGFQIAVFNAGGTGSLSFNLSEVTTITEVTAGSGFYCPHLFDYYSNFKLKAAAFFALPSVRAPENGWLTCLGGGYIASGEPGWDRVPKTMNPKYKLSSFEACGEVQTPVQCDKNLGDPILFRHAKAGELMERFNSIYLVENGKVINEVETYRGLGWCFL